MGLSTPTMENMRDVRTRGGTRAIKPFFFVSCFLNHHVLVFFSDFFTPGGGEGLNHDLFLHIRRLVGVSLYLKPKKGSYVAANLILLDLHW